jgi:hypothetical protein
MPDETTSSPAPSSGAATTAASTPSSTASQPDTSSKPAASQPESTETPASSEPEWSPDAFDWDSWDGSDEALPEPHRPVVKRVTDWHKSRAQAETAEQKRLKELYEAILSGDEDPRISEYDTKYKTAEQKLAQYEQELREHKAEMAAVEEYILKAESERQAKEDAKHLEQAEAFRAANQWVFDEQYQQTGSDLLDEGWHYSKLPELLKMPASILKVAREAFTKVKDPDIAIRLAKAETKSERTGTEDFVQGAVDGTRKATVTEKPNLQALKGRDRFAAAARQNISRHNRGR